MVAGRPWYKRNPSDFIVGTIGWDLELRGAYSLLIDMLNERDRPIPDEPKFVAGCMGVSVRKWGQLRQRLLDTGKITLTADGCLTNPRFDREHGERRGEHEEAVENGRKGGLKSAAMRNVDQGDLDFISPKTPRKRVENDAKTEKSHEINDDDTPKNNDLAQAPPQPSRARKSPEDRVIQPNDSLEPARSADQTPDDPPLDRTDLKALFDACTQAAGFNPISPGVIAREYDILKEWREAGFDFTRVVIPTIKAIVSKTTDPTSSLKRFTRFVQLEHAKAKGKPEAGPGAYVAPASPLFTFDGEDREFEPIRRDLAEAITQPIYAMLANTARFERIDDRPIMRVSGRYKQEIRDHLNRLKLHSKFGFTDVW